MIRAPGGFSGIRQGVDRLLSYKKKCAFTHHEAREGLQRVPMMPKGTRWTRRNGTQAEDSDEMLRNCHYLAFVNSQPNLIRSNYLSATPVLIFLDYSTWL